MKRRNIAGATWFSLFSGVGAFFWFILVSIALILVELLIDIQRRHK